MAELTVLREAARCVIGIVGSLIILQVAGVARRGQRRVLSARMTLLARGRGVRAGQGELSSAVIEFRAQPLRGGMAELTSLRETGGDMIGTGGGLVVLQMAGNAIRTDVGVVAIGMTLKASDRAVCSGQRELGQIVIEFCAVPS